MTLTRRAFRGPWLACLAALWLAGCELLPDRPFTGVVTTAEESGTRDCNAELPDFEEPRCLLPDWVAFGLAAQRGDSAWRADVLERLAGEAPEKRLARAVALSWGSYAQWQQASELYKADLHAAPADLQPLLRYWLNEVERRRTLVDRLAEAERAREALAEENAELAEKLDALTAIERNINLRQQTN